jgi:Domain of unknown function (DUF4258)
LSRFEHEAARLRALASSKRVRIRWRQHAEEEAAKDGIAKIDIENMLCRCSVTMVEESKGEETWRAEGTDVDGRTITAVVVGYEDAVVIKIITCWARGRR